MAILRNGIAGHYSGKIGNLVFYIRNGKQVVRTIGRVTKPPTENQLRSRKELAVVIGFLKPITEFINIGFALKAMGSTRIPHNMAVSYNRLNALQGVYPDTAINYEKALVTQGSMLEALSPTVEATAEGLSFTWQCPADLPWPRETDRVMLLAYFPAWQKAVYLLSGASRSLGVEVLTIQPGLLNEHIEVYISFIAENRNGIANSTYLGSFNK
jgi:hypothetical protein